MNYLKAKSKRKRCCFDKTEVIRIFFLKPISFYISKILFKK
ncbi:hypothetical protein MuYL_2431 [Mucilaginibacter xinganensis]|uniref:Uncharacterized protein n=1 Tax=Mucilaginibacter xinganensis TaxID=1234841 RepID=A0A223NXK2_9SPHI|nr:hypothetical protein MuYL_2431 [Mucilaginibacter xinganensis]